MAVERKRHSDHQGGDMSNWAAAIINQFANPFRKMALSSPVIYRTKEGIEHRILATPWAESAFQGLQDIGFDNINKHQIHSAFTVLKEQLTFDEKPHVNSGWQDMTDIDGTTMSHVWQDMMDIDGFVGQNIWQDMVDISTLDFVFHEPKAGDEIIEEDGTRNTVSTNAGMPQWYYDPHNPCKNTIIINTMRLRGHE